MGGDVVGLAAAGEGVRPYVCLSDDTHPFSDEEALYTSVTTTRRAVAIPLTDDDFDGLVERLDAEQVAAE